MMRRVLDTFGVCLAVVLLLAAVCTWLVMVRNWLWLPVVSLCLLVAVWRFYKLYRHNNQKIAFLLDAIENNNPAVHFYEKVRDDESSQVNRMLNRIARILYNVKIETAQREKYYELILDFVETAIVVLNDAGAVFQKNKKAMQLLGMDIFTHVRQLSRVSDILEIALTEANPGERLQVDYPTERGTMSLLLRVSGIRIKDEDLRIIALSDINSELDEREIDSWIRLTRVLTHEIMNSLSPITSLSETLMHLPGAEDKEMKQGLETIRATGSGLMNFVNSYRRLTRLPQPEPSLFYVEPFLKRMTQLATHQHPCPHIAFEQHVADGLIVWADEHLLAQVLTNLLSNALQAIGPQEGHIRLTAYREENTVCIEVANDGPRITEEMAGQIFVPFFTTKEEGSGIGLSLSKQIMRISGGTLTLRPYTSPDAWTTFVVTLRLPAC
ncbi:MAG: GHKL domain-containing protein [Bacteroides sp.]|nr:GHKL domain-containing protein [Bacteroides sp.]MBQ8601075.1 GHKL domain-containing protein [Bacteroides sp.]